MILCIYVRGLVIKQLATLEYVAIDYYLVF